jgi:hypothetical protein
MIGRYISYEKDDRWRISLERLHDELRTNGEPLEKYSIAVNSFFDNFTKEQEERYHRLDLIAYELFSGGKYVYEDDIEKRKSRIFYIGKFDKWMANYPHHKNVNHVSLSLPFEPEDLKDKESDIFLKICIHHGYDGGCDVLVPLLKDHKDVPEDKHGLYHIFLRNDNFCYVGDPYYEESYEDLEDFENAVVDYIDRCYV